MIRLGVDAFNLELDRRGMGRYARAMLAGLREYSEFEITLIDRDTLRNLRGHSFDVLWYPWNGVRFAARAPKVVTIHDPFAFTQPHRSAVARWREQRPIRHGARIAQAITTVSKWSAQTIGEILRIDAAAIEVIPPVLDPFWQPVQSARAMRPYFLFVAGPEPRKNATMLFAAFKHAFPQGEAMLAIVGTLSAADATQLNTAGIVHERLSPDDEALRELYSSAVAVAVPSLAEGYGLMAIEGMACGAPVLAADAAALPETCDGAALLIAPDDPQAWSTGLRRVWDDRVFGLALRDRSLERVTRFDSKRSVSAMAALLQRVARDTR
ncbi:MAG: glycosyltransferase [Candidatus Eremiobacteraeota bacterium]|nr:glycosyltransferase [Candidatus Eremiobacteraeota bacterium]